MAATLQRKCSGGLIFVIITKSITKIVVPRNHFVIVSARMVGFCLHFWGGVSGFWGSVGCWGDCDA